jgi:hypothetical protein
MKRLVRPTQDVIPFECWGLLAEWLTYRDASSLRSVSKLLCDVVKGAILDDPSTCVFDTDKWLACFPSAVSLKVTTTTFAKPSFPLKHLTYLRNFEVEDDGTDLRNGIHRIETTTFNTFKFDSLNLNFGDFYEDDVVLYDSFFETLDGIKHLELGLGFDLTNVTDAAFSHLKGIRKLHLTGCGLWENRNITAAAMHSLIGIESLQINGLFQIPVTDSFFAPLRGIKYLSMDNSDVEITDAAFEFIQGVQMLNLRCYDEREDLPASLGLSQVTRNGFLSLAGIKSIAISCYNEGAGSTVKPCELKELFPDDYLVETDSRGYFRKAQLKTFPACLA